MGGPGSGSKSTRSPQERLEIQHLASRGLTAREIGAKVGSTRAAIIGYCYREDIPLLAGSGGPWSGEDVRTCIKMLKDGKLAREVAKKLGKETGAVMAWCRRNGISLRHREKNGW